MGGPELPFCQIPHCEFSLAPCPLPTLTPNKWSGSSCADSYECVLQDPESQSWHIHHRWGKRHSVNAATMTFTLTHFCTQVYFKLGRWIQKGSAHLVVLDGLWNKVGLGDWTIEPFSARGWRLPSWLSSVYLCCCLFGFYALRPTKVWEGSSRLGA